MPSSCFDDCLVRRAQFYVGEQSSLLVVAARNQFDHFLAVLVHFVLLHLVADQDGAGRKAWLARCMLRMKVRCRQIQLVLGCELFRHLRDRGAVAGPKAGINHQRCVAAIVVWPPVPIPPGTTTAATST